MYQLNLPEQTVAAALTSLSEQTDIQVLFPYDIATQHRIEPLVGSYQLQHALEILLHNTGLHGGLTDSGVITISQIGSNVETNQNGKGKRMNTNKRKTLLATMVGLFATGGVSTIVAQEQVGDAAKAQGILDEIIVTSTRRETSLNDTAVSIAAISGEDIAREGLSGMDDYLRLTPGVSFVDRGVSRNAVIVRGIAADLEFGRSLTGPTVGAYFGEAPISGFGSDGGGMDLKLVDMERIEILRGPQGTLFGAGSLSGTVRNIPNKPNLSEIEGSVLAQYSHTSDNGDGNDRIEGVINIPLIEDVLAIRGVAYNHNSSGYIKNVAGSHPSFSDVPALFGGDALAIDQEEIGASEVTGGRLAILWRPTDKLDLTLQYANQETDQDGLPKVQLDVGGYNQLSLQMGNVFSNTDGLLRPNKDTSTGESLAEELDFINLVIEYDLGWATVISSTFDMSQDSVSFHDDSAFVGGIPLVRLYGYENSIFVEELRLVSQDDGPWQYVVGLYYEDAELSNTNIIHASGDLALQPFGAPFGVGNSLINQQYIDRELTQKAIFGELSYALSEQVEVTFGARRFDYEKDTRTIGLGAFSGSEDSPSSTDEKGTTYKANVSYRPSDDQLFYAQWSEGFRLGNTQNLLPLSLCDVDNNGILDGTSATITSDFDSDTLENFELGAKLTMFDSRVQLNASLFRMNWEGIPLNVISPTCFFTMSINAGEARSEGFEAEALFSLTENLLLSLGGSYTDAELKTDSTDLNAFSGDPLPGSPGYNISFGVNYDFTIKDNPSFIKLDYAHVGGFYNNLQETGAEAGDYGQLNMKLGVAVDQFSIGLFATNVTNDDSITWVGSQAPDNRGFRLRPRTIGLDLGYRF